MKSSVYSECTWIRVGKKGREEGRRNILKETHAYLHWERKEQDSYINFWWCTIIPVYRTSSNYDNINQISSYNQTYDTAAITKKASFCNNVISSSQIPSFFSGLITDLCWKRTFQDVKYYARERRGDPWDEEKQKLRSTLATAFTFGERRGPEAAGRTCYLKSKTLRKNKAIKELEIRVEVIETLALLVKDQGWGSPKCNDNEVI